ncbi:hypothetical protein EJB05_12411, partial [Eragrostis curvula]
MFSGRKGHVMYAAVTIDCGELLNNWLPLTLVKSRVSGCSQKKKVITPLRRVNMHAKAFAGGRTRLLCERETRDFDLLYKHIGYYVELWV